tara:strand:- start:342 stop:920 length:579 start_codon:yes stop_codon:yes gene_type:complete
MFNSLNQDEKLVQGLRKGDPLCFKFIFDKLYDPLIVFTYGYTHDIALAEDIVQHCFMKLWEKRESLDQTASLKTFLYTIARNRFVDLYRKDNKNVLLSDTIYLEAILESEETSEDDLESRMEQIDRAVENLPKKCKQVFLMKRQDNLRNQEIADYLGISLKTVEDHVSRALRIIREHILFIIIFINEYIVYL